MIGDILNIGSKIIDKLFPDKTKADEAKLKLFELQQQGEFKAIDAEIEKDKMRYADVAAARQREQEFAKSGKRDITPPLLAISLTIGFFGLLIFIACANISKEASAIIEIMIGALGTSFATVIAYYFGSSSGSKTKDHALDKIIEKLEQKKE